MRFGAFEIDLRSGELRKHGIKIKLQGQPFQVLQLLLERHGEIVTREELRSKLWPENTFVDFDVGLNTAVKRLREALGDSAESSHYVETLPRKGYRFIAAVESIEKGTARLPGANDQSQKAVATSRRWKIRSAGICGRNHRDRAPLSQHWEVAAAIPPPACRNSIDCGTPA